MGQKVNPTGFRIGILQGWKSNWYTERDYASYLDEDRADHGIGVSGAPGLSGELKRAPHEGFVVRMVHRVSA